MQCGICDGLAKSKSLIYDSESHSLRDQNFETQESAASFEGSPINVEALKNANHLSKLRLSFQTAARLNLSDWSE